MGSGAVLVLLNNDIVASLDDVIEACGCPLGCASTGR